MAFAGLVLSVSGFANAGIIAYDFEFQLNGGTYLTGSFTAEDLNLDNIIIDDELIGLSFYNASFSLDNYVFNAAISDNFNFDINANEFLLGGDSFEGNGQRWNFGATGFGFTAGSACAGLVLDGSFQGCDAVPATNIFQVVSVASVPEPSTLAIFALGIMGLASRRFKKQ